MYATTQDLEDRFGAEELAMLAESTDTVDRALADAEVEINSAVRGRYALPMSPIDPLLTAIACDIARLKLHADRPTDAVKDAADAARKLLSEIAAGRRLLDAALASQTETTAGLVEIVSGRRKTPFVG